MKKFAVIITALLFNFLSANMLFASANTWTQKADFGGAARWYAVGFSIGSKGYIGMGYASYYKDFWEYDPTVGTNGTWTQKTDFGGTARCSAVGFSIGSKGYIGTGTDGSYYYKDFWEYDSAGNSWTQKADFGGTERWGAVGFSIGSKGYIGTGAENGFLYKKDFWEYNPSINSWTQKADFGGTARFFAVGFSIGSKGYIGTGFDGSVYKDFWEYDPSGNSWTQKADFGGTERRSAVGFSIGSKGYIGTGVSSLYIKDFWEYDPAGNSWTQKADFGGTARSDAVGFSIGSKGYIGTGYDESSGTKDFWEYEPIDTFSPSLSVTSHNDGQHVTTPNIILSGTASDGGKGDNGIQQVTVNGGRASNDTATGGGTANWYKGIPLNAGTNSITVVAYDNSSNHNSTTKILTVYYESAQAPTVTTGPATRVTPNSATLNGTVNPNGLSTTYYFDWGTTTAYGNTSPATPASAGGGWYDVAVSANITGLTLNTNYHYRLVATNSLGITYGSDMSFKASVILPWLMLLLGD